MSDAISKGAADASKDTAAAGDIVDVMMVLSGDDVAPLHGAKAPLHSSRTRVERSEGTVVLRTSISSNASRKSWSLGMNEAI